MLTARYWIDRMNGRDRDREWGCEYVKTMEWTAERWSVRKRERERYIDRQTKHRRLRDAKKSTQNIASRKECLQRNLWNDLMHHDQIEWEKKWNGALCVCVIVSMQINSATFEHGFHKQLIVCCF